MHPVLAGLIAAAATAAAAAIAPAPAHADGAFTATDFAWTAAGGGTTVTIAPGERVSFHYPSGMSMHNAQFAGLQPSGCTPALPADAAAPGWSSLCTFPAAGQYPFACELHPAMTGTVVVQAGGGPPPPPPPPPAPPPPAPAATAAAASSLRLARAQRGSTVRGSIVVARGGSQLDVRARLRGVRAGSVVRRAVGPGRVRFAVTLSRSARRTLRRSGRLRLSVRITVTPAAGTRYVATRTVTLRAPGA